MKTLALGFVTLGLFTFTAFGQADVIARERAKRVAEQNNTRPVEPPPAGGTPGHAAPAPAPTPTITPVTPSKPNAHQQNIAKLKADLAKAHAEHKATDQLKQEFSKDLLSVAQGTVRPSAAAASRLADSLLTALASASVTAAADDRLVQKLVVLVNSSGLSATRTQEIAGEAQAALQSAGVSAADAAKVSSDLQSLAAELRPAA